MKTSPRRAPTAERTETSASRAERLISRLNVDPNTLWEANGGIIHDVELITELVATGSSSGELELLHSAGEHGGRGEQGEDTADARSRACAVSGLAAEALV